MTRDETVNRFLECEAKRAEALAAGKSEGEVHEAAKAHWNAWAKALLAERKAMEADGRWSLEPVNEATRDWSSRAETNFISCLFLNKGAVNEEREAEAKAALEKRASKAKCKSIPVDAARTRFDGFVFPGNAWFHGATFTRDAWFESATFTGNAWFHGATFTGDASFHGATFTRDARFESATFTGTAWFESARFRGLAWFISTRFNSGASFRDAAFTNPAFFESARFIGRTSFHAQTFTHDVFFNKARFGGDADFRLATFEQVAEFDGAVFEGEADFNAVRGERSFSMAAARFEVVPDFFQSHFAEAPRLDNVTVKGRIFAHLSKKATKGNPENNMVWGELPWHIRWRRYLTQSRTAVYDWASDGVLYYVVRVMGGIPKDSHVRDFPARWRALKRLAVEGHDPDRELAFFSGEVRSARFAGDWPVPWPIWKAAVWGGFFRFWFGILYEVFSNLGRSVFLPFFAWSIGIAAFAAFYLSQTDVMQRDLALREVSYSSAAAQAGRYAMSNAVPCYPPPPTFTERWRGNWGLWRAPKSTPASNSNETIIGGLSEKLRGRTNARAEALHLAVRNAFIVLDGGSDASHRMYGCLYGLELYAGQNPVPIVPSAVSTASAIQKLISGVLIFLFGLALRNMLKVK